MRADDTTESEIAALRNAVRDAKADARDAEARVRDSEQRVQDALTRGIIEVELRKAKCVWLPPNSALRMLEIHVDDA